MPKTLRDRLIANKKQTAPVAKLLGMRIVRQRRGQAVLTMRAKKEHLNTIGTVHGGILCDLSDAAMGYAFTTLLGKEQIGMTVEFKINFLKPVFVSEKLKASAKVLSHGKTLYYIECAIRNSRNQLVAKAASTCKVI
jgi:uncharacterized protein (TIGR00369 family)